MSKKLIREYVFTPGIANAGTVKIPGRYSLDKILLITNTTDNQITYSFGNGNYAGTTAVFTTGNSTDFPEIDQREDGYTTITLAYNTSNMSASDKLQIYVENTYDEGVTMRPWAFGTDAIERMRVSNPESH